MIAVGHYRSIFDFFQIYIKEQKNLNMVHQNGSDPSEHLWRCPQILNSSVGTIHALLVTILIWSDVFGFIVIIVVNLCTYTPTLLPWYLKYEDLSPIFLLFSWCPPLLFSCVCGCGFPAFWHLTHLPHLPPVQEPWSSSSSRVVTLVRTHWHLQCPCFVLLYLDHCFLRPATTPRGRLPQTDSTTQSFFDLNDTNLQ